MTEKQIPENDTFFFHTDDNTNLTEINEHLTAQMKIELSLPFD